MIALHGVEKSYDRLRALQGVSFRLGPGSLCGLLGHNGAGKSTLFKILVGLVEPDAGRLEVMGRPTPFGDAAFKRSIGYVPENDLLDDYLTVAEFLDFVAAVRDVPAAERAIDIPRWLEFFELGPKRDALLLECSHGMRRKVGLAAALLGRPRLLLLDEAMNGLDPESRARLKLELKAFCAGGGTVLFSTHVLETVETLCDRVLILAEGKLLRELVAGEWSASGPGSLEGLFLGAGAEEADPGR